MENLDLGLDSHQATTLTRHILDSVTRAEIRRDIENDPKTWWLPHVWNDRGWLKILGWRLRAHGIRTRVYDRVALAERAVVDRGLI